MCSWESTLQNTTGLHVNFAVLYVKLIDLSYSQITLAKFSKNVLSLIQLRNNCALVTRSVLGSVFFT